MLRDEKVKRMQDLKIKMGFNHKAGGPATFKGCRIVKKLELGMEQVLGVGLKVTGLGWLRPVRFKENRTGSSGYIYLVNGFFFILDISFSLFPSPLNITLFPLLKNTLSVPMGVGWSEWLRRGGRRVIAEAPPHRS